MKKRSGLKRALLVLFILSLVSVVAFLVLFMLTPLTYPVEGAQDIGVFLGESHKIIGQAFVLPFGKENAVEMMTAYSAFILPEALESTTLMISVLVYVLTGLFAILLVLGLIFVITKKKAKFIPYSLAVLAALYISYVLVAWYPIGLFEADYFAINYPGLVGEYVAMIYIGFSVGDLAFCAVIATVVLGLIYSAKSAKASLVKEEAEAITIAEAVGDPEAIQEGEELIAPEPELIAEPEPVPEIEEVKTEEPVDEPEPEPVAKPEPAPAPQPGEDKHVEVNVNNNGGSNQGVDQASLASLLREVVRDIVRDEIARNNLNQPQQQPQQAPNGGNQTITGATFGGPLVVQYFNGGINGVSSPSPAPQVVEAPAPAQVEQKKEEPKPEPKPEPVAEAKVEEKPAPRPLFVKKEAVEAPKPATPVVEAKPAEEPKKYERLTFAERLLQSEKDIHDLYNELKNEILSWGVKSRVSAVGDTFRLHKKMYVRITVAGKSLKLYFALNPADYANSTIPVQDASGKDMYQEIPLVFKVKSGLSVRRCKDLIQDVMEKDGLEQGEVGKVNWVKELKAELASGKKKDDEE